MLIPCDEVNILNTFRVMIILRLLLLLTNLYLKLLSTQGTGADKLLSTQRVKDCPSFTDHTQQIDMNERMNPQRNVKKTEATIISNIYKKINDGP